MRLCSRASSSEGKQQMMRQTPGVASLSTCRTACRFMWGLQVVSGQVKQLMIASWQLWLPVASGCSQLQHAA